MLKIGVLAFSTSRLIIILSIPSILIPLGISMLFLIKKSVQDLQNEIPRLIGFPFQSLP